MRGYFKSDILTSRKLLLLSSVGYSNPNINFVFAPLIHVYEDLFLLSLSFR